MISKHSKKGNLFHTKAFTLAEVLIVLGIVGIIAAMTIPIIMLNVRNQELEAGLKKAYSTLSAATQLVIQNDYGGTVPVASSVVGNDYFNEIGNLFSAYTKYLVSVNVCKYNKTCSSLYPVATNFCLQIAPFIVQNYKSYNGKTSASWYLDDVMIILSDGMFVIFDGGNGYGHFLISVDVNGWQKLPNKFGYDMFMFELLPNGKLVPLGSKSSGFLEVTYCSTTSTGGLNGLGCTAKALNEKDYFKNLPK